MPGLRVLHVIESLEKGGAERLVIDICKGLRKFSDTEVKLITFNEKNDFRFLTGDMDITVCPSRMKPSILKKGKDETADFLTIVKRWQPHIIHSHLVEAEFVVQEHPQPGIAYVSHLHGELPFFGKAGTGSLLTKRGWTNLFDRYRLISKYQGSRTHFVAISSFIKKYFESRFPAALRQNIHVIYNPVDLSRFKGIPRSHPGEGKKIKLINTARLVKYKNQEFLVHVIAGLKRRGYDIHLDILGEGPERQNLENLITGKRLDTEITLWGNVDNVEEYLQNSDIYLHSATDGLFGIALMEAMAAGLPFVALRGREDGDRIRSGDAGYIVENEDIEEFCDRVAGIIENKGLYQTMSYHSIHFAEQYDIRHYIEKLTACYQSIVK